MKLAVPVQTEADLKQILRPKSAYRGESNASWQLESRLERGAREKYGEAFRQYLPNYEASIIDNFIDRCARLDLGELYSPNKLPDMSNSFEWLSIMQHYGYPTRLIDFTDDAWVALCFALQGARPGIPFAIYELEMLPGDEAGNKLPKDANGKIYRVPADGNRPNVNELLGLTIKFRHFESRYRAKPLGPEWSSPKQNFGWDKPTIQNVRMRRQRGMFLYQLWPDGRLEDIPHLIKHSVSPRLQNTARLMLESLGPKYSEEFLFPRFEERLSSVAEIEKAIAKLPRGEFVELERWFDAERNRLWDRQIEADAQSGKLRELYQRLQSENQGQPHVPLDEFLARCLTGRPAQEF